MRSLISNIMHSRTASLCAGMLAVSVYCLGVGSAPVLAEEAGVGDPTAAEAEVLDAEQEVHDESHFPLKKPELLSWSFAGVFGRYDPAQLQRGLQVYREVCSACHSLKYVAFRNLSEPGGLGYSEAQVKALAAEYQITDGPNDDGEMYDRPGIPADHFPRRKNWPG